MDHAASFSLAGLEVCPLRVPSLSAKFDLTLLLDRGPADFHGCIEFSTELFEQSRIEAFIRVFSLVLSQLCRSDPARRLLDIRTAVESGMRDQSQQSEVPAVASIEDGAIKRSSPTSPLQERWFVLNQHGYGHVNMLATVQGPLSSDLFRAALESLCRRHDILRSLYELGTPPRQRVLRDWKPVAHCTDLLGAPEHEKNMAVCAAVERSLAPFDVQREVPFELELLTFGPDRSLLVGRMHHIASDGWSTALRLDDFELICRNLEAGRNPNDLPRPPQYADYARAHRRFIESISSVRSGSIGSASFQDARHRREYRLLRMPEKRRRAPKVASSTPPFPPS